MFDNNFKKVFLVFLILELKILKTLLKIIIKHIFTLGLISHLKIIFVKNNDNFDIFKKF